MPEIEFVVEWPDGTRDRCYSPSRAVGEHLTPGSVYPVAEFLDRARAGLGAASQRVLEVYGFPCGRARDQLAALERRSQAYSEPESTVSVISLGPWSGP